METLSRQSSSMDSRWIKDSLWNTFSVLGWAGLFYVLYFLSFIISLAIPLLAAWVLNVVFASISRLLGLLPNQDTSNWTMLAAFFADLIIVRIYLRVLWEVWFGRSAHIGAVVETDGLVRSKERQSGASRIDDLVLKVTERLAVPSFSQIDIISMPMAATYQLRRRRILVLGWLLFFYLTENEIKAIVAHEAAHYDQNAMFYHRILWRLNQSVKRYCIVTNHVAEELRRKKQEKGSGSLLEQVQPLVDMALFYPEIFLKGMGHHIERRLSQGNYRFELYCDRVAAQHFGSNALSSALQRAIELNHVYIYFCQDVDNPENVNSVLEAFEAFRKVHFIDSDELDTLYSQAGRSHPSLKDRLTNIEYLPTKPSGHEPFMDVDVDRYHLAQLDWEMTKRFVDSVVRVQGLLPSGVDAIQKRQYVKAVNCLSDLVTARPKMAIAWGQLGIAYYNWAQKAMYRHKYQRLEEATRCLDQALRLLPSSEEKLCSEFTSYLKAAREALRFRVGVWYGEGGRRAKRHLDSKAVEAYDRVLRLDPTYKFPWPIINKGKSLTRLRRYDEARECYLSVLAQDEDNPAALLNLSGLALVEVAARYWPSVGELGGPATVLAMEHDTELEANDIQKLEEAIQWSDRLLAASWKPAIQATAWTNKAVAFRMMHRYSAAIACYQQAHALWPKDANIRAFLEACKEWHSKHPDNA